MSYLISPDDAPEPAPQQIASTAFVNSQMSEDEPRDGAPLWFNLLVGVVVLAVAIVLLALAAWLAAIVIGGAVDAWRQIV